VGAINRSKLAAIVGLLMLAGCGTTPSGTFCDLASDKERPSQAEIDVMTPERRAALLAFYLRGQRLCGWKPFN